MIVGGIPGRLLPWRIDEMAGLTASSRVSQVQGDTVRCSLRLALSPWDVGERVYRRPPFDAHSTLLRRRLSSGLDKERLDASMRILFVSQYFPPEPGAPAARVSELARAWKRAGHDVTVLTALPHHPAGTLAPESRRRALVREEVHGVEVLRTWIYATPN